MVTFALLLSHVIITIQEYTDRRGSSPFARWFDGLDATAAAKVRTAIARLEQGNTSNVKSVGAGVSEVKISFGPGYRVYFGQDGATVVILLGGSTKQRQSRAIADAQACWHDYKQRKA